MAESDQQGSGLAGLGCRCETLIGKCDWVYNPGHVEGGGFKDAPRLGSESFIARVAKYLPLQSL